MATHESAQPTAASCSCTRIRHYAYAVKWSGFGERQCCFNGREVYPVTLQTVKDLTGISQWSDAGWTGSGVKVGIIDLAFGGLQQRMTDLGFIVIVYDGDSLNTYSNELNDHGTDVTEVIHSIAPGAELYVCKYDGTVLGLEKCAHWMKSQGVIIINHSAGIPIIPLNGENAWAQTVDTLIQEFALWINSAAILTRVT